MMLEFVYDVEVNWADGMGKSYLIPQYHEWYKDDEVEKFSCLPVIKVSKELYRYIEEDYNVLPQGILNLVYNKAEQKVDGLKQEVAYAFIVTDGENMLAVDTDDEDVPNYKSYLTPKVVSRIEDMMYKLTTLNIVFEKPEPRKLNKKDQLASDLLLLDEQYVKGLTRTERDMKAILMTYLYTLLTSDNPDEVRYWYSEVFTGTFNNEKVKRMRKDTMVRQMFEELKEGWGFPHVSLGDEIVRSNTIFAESWKVLRKRQKEMVRK